MPGVTVYALQDGLTLLRPTDSSQAHSRPQAGAVTCYPILSWSPNLHGGTMLFETSDTIGSFLGRSARIVVDSCQSSNLPPLPLPPISLLDEWGWSICQPLLRKA